jgi:hybrid cluster-associated redox disulfide protein
MKITKNTKLNEILDAKGEKAAEILFKSGMGCVGCPMSQMESLEDGCKAHGMSDKEINEIVEKLNK